MTSWLQRLIKSWEITQVELNGKYSPERVRDLAQYTRKASWFRIVAVTLLTPLPCLLATVVIDALPLADPSEGLDANKFFWIREFYTFLLITLLAVEQIRYSVPILLYPANRAIVHSTITTTLAVALMYGLAQLIGFPVPFSILVVTPAWLSFIAFFLAVEWMKKIRETPGAEEMLINTLKLWICQVAMALIYPPYYFVFTTLSPDGQTLFSMLLPVIKLGMRNIYGRTVVHLSDEVPEVITFNIEVFNALFISYCMQNSPSVGTTLAVTAALLTQLGMSLRDVYEATWRMERLGTHLSEEHQYGDPRYLVLKSSIGAPNLNALQHADVLLLDGGTQQGAKSKRASNVHVRVRASIESPNPAPQDDKILAGSNDPGDTKAVDDKAFKFESRGVLQLQASVGARIQPAAEPVNVRSKRDSDGLSPISMKYVLEVRRLLYLTEFLVLIYYVGVFIPLIFSIYMAGMYHLPNRLYYAQLANLTKEGLYQTLENVLFNCSLKLLALILLCSVLQYKLRFSAIHQLAFVLEKQWFSVQTKTIFWVYYNVQCSLQHQGYDYNFQFAWLHKNSTSSTSLSNATNSTLP